MSASWKQYQPITGLRPRKRKQTTKMVTPAVKSYVAKAISTHSENKYRLFDLDSSFASVGSSWVEVNLTSISQGTQKGGRIGTRVKVKSLEVYGVYIGGVNQTVADDPWSVMRIVVASFRPSSNVDTPFQTATITIDDAIRKDYNNADGKLVKKYYDKYKVLPVASSEAGGGDGYTSTPKIFKYYKRFKNFYINWNSDASTYQDKALYLSMISDSGVVPHPGFVNGYAVLTFEDA